MAIARERLVCMSRIRKLIFQTHLNITKSTIHYLLIKTTDAEQFEAYLLPYISKSDLTKQTVLHTVNNNLKILLLLMMGMENDFEILI